MVKGFRPSLEPPADRQVKVNNSARPLLCVVICAGVASLVLSAFAASGWNFYINRFDKDRLHFSSGDEVAVSDVTNDFSSFFCDFYEVTLWERGQAYLLPTTAKVNASLFGPEETVSMVQAPGLAYRELSLYLLDESELSLSACRQNGSQNLPAQIVLIRGRANLRSWRADKTCSSCVEKRMHIPIDALCTIGEEELREQSVDDQLNINNRSTRATTEHEKVVNIFSENDAMTQAIPKVFYKFDDSMFNYTAPGNDRYYVVIFYGTPNGPESVFTEPGIKLVGTVKRTRFDVKNAKKVCNVTGQSPKMVAYGGNSNSNSSSTCSFTLPWNSDLDIVVHFGGLLSAEAREISHDLVDNIRGHMDLEMDTGTEDLLIHALNHDGMLTKCRVRLSVWICLFGALPSTIVIILSSVLGILLCRSRRRPAQVTATYRKRTRHSKRKKHRTEDGLVDGEVLPEGAQSSMAIQGD